MTFTKDFKKLASIIAAAMVLVVLCSFAVVRGAERWQDLKEDDLVYMPSSNIYFGFVQKGVQGNLDREFWFRIDSNTYKGTPKLNLGIAYDSANNHTAQTQPTKLYSDVNLSKAVSAGEKYTSILVSKDACAYVIELTNLPSSMQPGQTYYWVLPGKLFQSTKGVGTNVVVQFVYNGDPAPTPTPTPTPKLNGLVKGPDGNWAMYKDNKVVDSYTGLAKNQNGWYYVRNGYVQWSYSGFGQNLDSKKWYRVKNGRVDWSANGIYRRPETGVWYKTSEGRVTWNETGVFKNYDNNTWWRVKDSRVDFKAEGIYKNDKGWWKTTGGKVTFKETGIFKNENGTWYVSNSKVDFNKNGKVKFNGKTYTVTNGRAKLS